MARNDLLKQFDVSDEELEQRVSSVVEQVPEDTVQQIYQESVQDFSLDTILKGKVINISGNEVIVDVGYKSEGIIPLEQFDTDVAIPQAFEGIEAMNYLGRSEKGTLGGLLNVEKKATELAMLESKRPSITLRFPKITAQTVARVV